MVTPADAKPMPRARSTAAVAVIAVGCLAAALLLRYLLNLSVGNALPSVTVFAATAVAEWLGGRRAAVPVAVLGLIGSILMLTPVDGRTRLDEVGGALGIFASLATAAMIIGFGEAARAAQARAYHRSETLRITLHSIGDGVITTDINSRVTSLNAVAESLTGWTLAEATGQPLDTVFRIVNEDTRQPVENPAINALRDGTIVGLVNHTVLLRRDGAECPIDDSAAPIRDELDEVTGCVLVFRDVTAQRQLERERANQLQTARMAAAIIDSSDDAIIRKRLDGTIETWNAGAERLFGHLAADAIGKHISLVIPPDRIAEEERIIATLKAGRRIDHFETERVRADGTRRWVSLTISPIVDAAGEVIAASKIVRDVTARVHAETELKKFAIDLAEADRRKNEFLAMLAHELRNPLAPLTNAVRAIQLREPGDEKTVEVATGMLKRQIRQMSRLVNDLLDLSRISRGTIELRKARIPLTSAIDEAMETVRPLLTRMDHTLTADLPPDPLYVDADAGRLSQIIGNLLGNAAKFTDKGGRIWLSARRENGQAVIRIRDNGIGIAPEHLGRLFDMFVQVDSSLERSRDGLGIGLTLVKTLVDLHGGSVDVRSDGLGHGSEFTVRLPALPALAATEPAPERPAPPASSISRRVLIVDDSHDAAESMAMLLEFAGHHVFKAHDGADAVKTAERVRPDVVLMDIGLPILNGYEACRRIRSHPWGQSMLLVAITGWGQEDDREQSRDAGFDLHFVKPVDSDELLPILATGSPRASA